MNPEDKRAMEILALIDECRAWAAEPAFMPKWENDNPVTRSEVPDFKTGALLVKYKIAAMPELWIRLVASENNVCWDISFKDEKKTAAEHKVSGSLMAGDDLFQQLCSLVISSEGESK